MSRTLFIRLLCGCLLAAMVKDAGADGIPEREMRAAYLYNFALFTEWPNLTGDNIQLCILKTDQPDFAAEKIERKLINGKILTINTVATSAAAKSCQIFYISSYQGNNLAKIINDLADYPVLTVSDGEDAAQQGTMIELFVENNRLNFKVNNKAVHGANLNLSAKLLRLAKAVY